MDASINQTRNGHKKHQTKYKLKKGFKMHGKEKNLLEEVINV